jgi:hypothetical protein
MKQKTRGETINEVESLSHGENYIIKKHAEEVCSLVRIEIRYCGPGTELRRTIKRDTSSASGESRPREE